jgi:hypothetical protein
MAVLRFVSVFMAFLSLVLPLVRRLSIRVGMHVLVVRSDGPSGGDLVLPGSAARALAGDDHSLEEQLSTPHAPRLTPLDGARQAFLADRAGAAQRLGELDVARRLGEEELRVLSVTRQLVLVDAHTGERCVEDGGGHFDSSWVLGWW